MIPGALPNTHLLTASVWAVLHLWPLFLCLEEPSGLALGGRTQSKVKLRGTEQLNSQRHILES